MGKNYTAQEASLPESPGESDWDDAFAAPLAAVVPRALAGMRIDQALAKMFPQYSRNRLQAWLKSGHVHVKRGASVVLLEGKAPVLGGEQVEIAPPPVHDLAMPKAQRMPLHIVFEDADLIVIDKPAGLTVHPGAGNPDRTLMNALLAHQPALRQVPRAGIVHRLDKDTSGLMVVAKNVTAQVRLAEQLASRSVSRCYLALVHGDPPARGTIDAPIGRDTRARTRMAVTQRGKEARTNYRVLERFGKGARPGCSLLECRLDTGRTHQIRVHLQHIGLPILGDPVYRRGARHGIPFARQALHAAELELLHPRSGKRMRWRAPLPPDMAKLLARLRHDG
ncbi:MAG TPA: RluA family pseudouridine synthase [Burkholderiales bacterium]|nr:RluA family pseudouridine synthase [Burkholderiales bacterium]